jgi:hypothetical protein
MNWTLLFLVTVAVVALLVNTRATYVLMTGDSATRAQKIVQTCIVWLLPILGALLMLALHDRRIVPPSGAPLSADEINPLVNQALQPIAKTANRAAERVIQEEVLDAVTEQVSDTGAHDPS